MLLFFQAYSSASIIYKDREKCNMWTEMQIVSPDILCYTVSQRITVPCCWKVMSEILWEVRSARRRKKTGKRLGRGSFYAEDIVDCALL